MQDHASPAAILCPAIRAKSWFLWPCEEISCFHPTLDNFRCHVCVTAKREKKMFGKIMTILFGIILMSVAVLGIGFMTMMTGLMNGAQTKDFLFMASVATGPLGPLFILGIHCALFRWIMPPRFDFIFIVAVLLVAVIPLFMVLVSQEPGAKDLIGFLIIAPMMTAFFSIIGIKAGRTAPSKPAG